MANHWDRYRRHWENLGPPLRPPPEVVAAYRAALDADDKRLLMLGVTPELAALGRELLAVDGSLGMVAAIWPGDDRRRRAILADWSRLPLADGSRQAVLGDGALSSNPFPDPTDSILAEIARVLAPDGIAAFRVYCRPEQGESLAAVRRAALAGEAGGFHALKWRVAMAVAAERGGPNMPVRDILAAFEATFPDRAVLVERTGWPPEVVATIDAYAASDQVYAFPTVAEILALVGRRFGDARAVSSGDYTLAERCPLIVFGRDVG